MSLCSGLTLDQSLKLYRGVLLDNDTQTMRQLCLDDLFFLLHTGCMRQDMAHPWLYERCREFEAEPDFCLDLWSREHYKSTIITYGGTLQDILRDPEITVGIFSHTRPIAKGFLKQIMTELETNDFLKGLFPDILWSCPKREAPCWSLDGGLCVRRKSNPKEMTVSAWGLVDGQPTSKHFSLLVYDDVVTRESVTSPEQIEKTTGAWELSLNLGAHGGRRRYIGTRYHFNDTWRTLIERGAAKSRVYPATDDGTLEGKPVFLDRKTLDEKRRDMGPYTFGCQMLQNPVADSAQGFKEEWMRYYSHIKPNQYNIYIIVDPAGGKKKDNDYTVMWVVGLGSDNNYYVLDGVRDRLNLAERTKTLFRLVRKWNPIKVGYERYGLQSDIEHIEEKMELENYRFTIEETGGSMAKEDRIRKLVPPFEAGRVWFPTRLLFQDYEGVMHDLSREFVVDELTAFPVAIHDDMLDGLARIRDPNFSVVFPELEERHEISAPPAFVQHDYDPLA